MVTQPQTNRELLKKSVQGLAQLPHVQIIIKPHPWERKKGLLGDYEQLVLQSDRVSIVPPEVMLYDLIPYTDYVVMENSTVGLEAMLFGKPVIVLRDPDAIKQYPYYDSLKPYILETPDSLVALIKETLDDPSAAQRLKDKIAPFLAHSYPAPLSGPALRELLDEITGKPLSSQESRSEQRAACPKRCPVGRHDPARTISPVLVHGGVPVVRT